MTSDGSPYEVPEVVSTSAVGTIIETTIVASVASPPGVNIGTATVTNAEVYNGSIPGPTFRLNPDDTVIVRLVNDLPYVTGIHWHGIELHNSADGTPVTQDGLNVGPFPQPVPVSPSGGTYLYRFKAPRPGIHWYHPHHFHSTNRVFRGLYGMIVVADPLEAGLIAAGTLPGAADTLQAVLSDITVCKSTNDTATYADLTAAEWLSPGTAQSGPTPAQLCETAVLDEGGDPAPAGFTFAANEVPNIHKNAGGRTVEGQTVLTNGVNVGPRGGTPGAPDPDTSLATTRAVDAGQGLRLQLVNCAHLRYFRLRLTQADGTQVPIVRIGGEGGLLDRARLEGGTVGTYDTKYETGEILLPPAARADVVIAIPAGLPLGSVLTLWTRDFQRTGGGNPGNWAQLPTVPVMHFEVTGAVAPADVYSIVGGDGGSTGTLLRPPPNPADPADPGDLVETLGAATGNLLDPATFVPTKPGHSDETIKLMAGASPSTNGFDPSIPGEVAHAGHFGGAVYSDIPHILSSRFAEAGDILELSVRNETQAHHPFHLHGFSFQPKSLSPNGAPAVFNWPYQEFMDVVDVPAGHTLTFRVRLDDRELADGVTNGGALGRWLFHCHIFFHAHGGMISELVVTNDVGGAGSEKPNVDVGGSWAYTPLGAVAVLRKGTYDHPDGDPVTLSASRGTVTDIGGGKWEWEFDATAITEEETDYVYITATDSSGRQDQAPFRLKIGGADDGSDSGDPHLRTVDGLRYDFQAVGEFTLLKDREGMEIQTRQTPVLTANHITDPNSGLRSCVSVNTAVALRVGFHRVSLQPTGEDERRLAIFVDGKELRSLKGGIDLGEHRVTTFDANGETGLRVDYAHHPVVMVTPRFWTSQKFWYMDVSVSHTQGDEGLMGRVPKNSWLPRLSSGASVGPMPKALHERYAVLYKTFADSWRVNDRTSLFVYAKGTSTVTFTDRGFPGESPPCKIKPGLENPGAAPLPGMSTLDARQVCQVVTDGEFFQNCVFDVATTGDKIFVESYLFAQELRRRATKVQVVAERPTTLPGEEFFVTAVTLPLRRRKTAPSGKVSFWVDNRRVGSAISLDAEGRARQKISGLGEGAHKIRAEFEPSNSEESLSCSSPNLLHQVRQKDDLHRPVYLRVVVEKIEVIDDRDCLGKGEVWFETCVETGYRGGTSVTKRLPSCGHFSVSDKPGKNVIELDTEIFRGVAADDLAIRIAGGEHDWLSENDPLGVYTRHFVGSAQSWLKTYRPDDESIDEEDVGLWKVTYRIEKVGG